MYNSRLIYYIIIKNMIPFVISDWIAKEIQKLNIKWIISLDENLKNENIDWTGEYNTKNPEKRYLYWYKKITEWDRKFVIYNLKEISICNVCRCSINSVADTMSIKWKVYCKACYYTKFDKPKLTEKIRKSK